MHRNKLQLPLDSTKEGVQETYRNTVQTWFGKHLSLSPTFNYLHSSAGGEALAHAKSHSIRATAHLYVVFQNDIQPETDYRLAMRELLGRCAVACALTRMEEASKRASLAARREQRNHEHFVNRVEGLDMSVRNLQEAASAVRSMLSQSVWRTLTDWLPLLSELQDDSVKAVTICGVSHPGRHPAWSAEYYAGALLGLANATNDGNLQSVSTWEAKWNHFKNKNLQEEPTGNPVLRCMDRMGLLEDSWLVRPDDQKWPNLEHLKDGLVDSRALLANRNITVLFLLFAIGATRSADSLPGQHVLQFPSQADVPTIVDGLNRLHDAIVSRTLSGVRVVRIEQEHDSLNIRLDTSASWGKGFANLITKMKEIKRADPEQHPGYARRNISMAVFHAFGLDRASWKEGLGSIDFLGDRIVRHLGGGGEICCEVDAEGFWLRYRNNTSQSQLGRI